MTVTLRVVLDQLVAPSDPDLAMASGELARALIEATPAGCDVSAIAPGAAEAVTQSVPELVDVWTAGVSRSKLLAAWQLGMPVGAGGMIHSPTLAAPLIRHDRVHDGDQTVVTIWDLEAWEDPAMPRAHAAVLRGLLKRAAKFADAVVVPTHAHADALAERVRVKGRVQVIAGAPPAGFAVPTDHVGRRRALDVDDGFVVVVAGDGLDEAFAGVVGGAPDARVVVLDGPEADVDAIIDRAEAAGLPADRVVVRGGLDAPDRAAVLGAASVVIAPSRRTAFPWRVVEALAVGAPVVAADSPVHRELLVDAGLLVGLGDAFADAISEVRAGGERWRVLAADRGRAFSWTGAAERTWALHADL